MTLETFQIFLYNFCINSIVTELHMYDIFFIYIVTNIVGVFQQKFNLK